MAKADLTVARLRDLLVYDPNAGTFAWRFARHHIRAGAAAGTINRRGYVRICIDGTDYMAHRLAWVYVLGEWPTGQIDHRNGVLADNRISNLRDVSVATNQQNRRCARSDSATGLLGVTPHGNRFQARIKISGHLKYLGLFDTAEDAHICYVAAKRLLHPGNLL